MGSTGSIGTQSLEVIRAQGYAVAGLAAHSNIDLLQRQIAAFHPAAVAVTDESAAVRLEARLAGTAGAPRVLKGAEGLRALAAGQQADIVLNAVVGIAGLPATLAALEAGLIPILCCGESLEQREAGITEEWITMQIKSALQNVPEEKIRKLIIAYEPIWAIGTDRKSTRLNSSHSAKSRMPSSA